MTALPRHSACSVLTSKMTSSKQPEFEIPSFPAPDFTFKCTDDDLKVHLFVIWNASPVVKLYLSDMKNVNEMTVRYTTSQMKQFLSYLYIPTIKAAQGEKVEDQKLGSIPWKLYEIFELFDTKHAENPDLFDISDVHPWKVTLTQMLFSERNYSFSKARGLGPKRFYPNNSIFDKWVKMMDDAKYAYTCPAIVRHVVRDCVRGLLDYYLNETDPFNCDVVVKRLIEDGAFLSVTIDIILKDIVPYYDLHACTEYIIALLQNDFDPIRSKLDEKLFKQLPCSLLSLMYFHYRTKLEDLLKRIGTRLEDDIKRKMIHYKYLSRVEIQNAGYNGWQYPRLVFSRNDDDCGCELTDELQEIIDGDPEYFGKYIKRYP